MLEEVKDVLDEVRMIQGVFESQAAVQSSMKSVLRAESLREFSSQLGAARIKFEKMAARAYSVGKGVWCICHIV